MSFKSSAEKGAVSFKLLAILRRLVGFSNICKFTEELNNAQRRQHCKTNTGHIIENIAHKRFIRVIPMHHIRKSAILDPIVQYIAMFYSKNWQTKTLVNSRRNII